MVKLQQQVEQFHREFGQAIAGAPSKPSPETGTLRLRLIYEEADELASALTNGSVVDIADAIGDLLYVVYGTAVSCGIDMEPITDEIHRSNMSKVGGHTRHDGKWIKPASYSPANLQPILGAQANERDERESNP
jgi:predicted HAD superfamily Cof-like phosphohydrolase